MSAVGSYFTTASPTVLAEMVIQAESRVRIGISRLYTGPLETTSLPYTQHEASIGLVAGFSYDLGEVASLGFEHVPSFEQPDTANVLESSLEILSEEETTITIGVRQFDPRILLALVRTGVMYTYGNERVITVGGKCAPDTRRPIEIAAENIGCNAPSSPQSVLTGLSAIVITAYDCGATSGLPWGDIVANELNVLDTEWQVYPVGAKASGNKLFNIYLY
jgi:hypothetical protein